jgi:hypothetical protein
MAQNLADNLYTEWSQTLGDVGKEAREGSPMAGMVGCGATLVMHSVSVAYAFVHMQTRVRIGVNVEIC